MKGINTFKRIISIILVSFMFILNVFAEETYNASYRIEIDEEQSIMVEETTLDGEIDNSDLEVQVIKKNRDDETVIYTGVLGEYENGIWSFTDFSEIQFLVIFDWESSEDEAVYIIPVNNENESQATDTVQRDVSLLSVEASSSDAKYSIKQAIIKNSDNVIVHDCPSNGQLESVTLIKHTNETVPAKVFAALYDDGKLENMKVVDVSGSGEMETEIVCDINLLFGTITENHYVKIMVLDGTNTLRPLVASYDTSIITTDYVYNNTIQTIAQEDEYTFTVPEDGYYNIEFGGNDSISAYLFHNDETANSITTSTFRETMSCSLSVNEIYLLKVTATETGAYSFSIKQTAIPESNVLSVGINKAGGINSPYGLEQFIFTPSTSANYDFYINSGEIYPVISIVDESGNEIGYEDNLTYKQDVFSMVEMSANKEYIITVKSRKDYCGSFTIIPRMISAVLNIDGTVSISAKFNNNINKKVGILAIDPDGSVEYLAQTISGSNGLITASAKINTTVNGTHSIIINSEDSKYGITYGLDCINSTKKQKYDFWNETDITGLSAAITYSASALSASTEITSTTEITNTSGETKTITVYNILFDANENIVEFSSVTDIVEASETRNIEKQKTMPETVAGYKWRTFVWLGKGNYNSSLRPVCVSKEINTSGITTNSLSVSSENITITEERERVSVREYTLNGQTKTLRTSELLNNIDISNTASISETDEEYNGEGVEYSYKIKHNGVYYSTIMPGTNEIEFYFKNTNTIAVSFIPYVWLVSINGDTLTEKYIQLGDYIILAPGEGTTTPWVHSMVLEDDYNLQLLYGDMLDLLFYMDYKGIIRFIPYDTMVTPLIFNKDDGGKFIYCNNPEALSLENLSDYSPPQLLYSEKGAGIGKYTLMAEHNNQLSEPVTIDVQFFTTNYARIKITAVGVQVPINGESWACEEAYSDYMQMNFAHNSGYSYKKFNYNEESQAYNEEAIYILDSSNSSVWLSDIYTKVYKDSNYPYIPEKKDGSYTCMYIVMDFEILDGAADINVAAYRNKYNQSPYCDDGAYYWDRMHKGISDTAAHVNANLFITLSDAIADDTWLPMRVFNQYNPYGFETTEWITNLNPQSDSSAKDKCAESDMSAFVYNDGKKSWYYGELVPENQRDYNWHFDTIHGDNKYPIISKIWVGSEENGHWQYTKSDVLPSNHIPNDILTLSDYQSPTDITSFDLACSMGNYSVKTYYYMYVFNIGSGTRTFEYWLDTASNNMLALYMPSENRVYVGSKGEYNGKECIFSIDIEPGDYEYFVILEVLPTGNSGGMKNSFRVSN